MNERPSASSVQETLNAVSEWVNIMHDRLIKARQKIELLAIFLGLSMALNLSFAIILLLY